ncbi:segregation and condensation protein B [Micromonospora rosaria]|uniref:Segregation and condensation protein B n=2 Tax=Micromonospora TaxID=1873 RepID=A0A136PJN0_9ACTN|nr:SMC-Scp complex subunit ScpB [Micromonospora rosaria]KXK58609.1 segregation and condensation protein B [Micromonospora rosaria]
MSNEERRDSLAEQAAAWVPPWAPERRTATPDPEPAADPAPEPASATEATVAPGPQGPDGVPAPEPAATTAPEPDELSASGSAVTSAPDADVMSVSEPSVASVPEPGAAPAPERTPDGPGGSPEPAGPDSATPAIGAGEPAAEAAGARSAGRRGRGRRAAPEPVPVVLADAELRGALEAILLVVDEPVSELVLAQVVEQPAERVGRMLDEIAAGYTAAGYGFELRRAAGGWRLYTRPEYAGYVERFVLDGQSVRLTQAALETLAVVAYKQPVTRSRISAIRGVNCDGVLRTLVSRGLVEECGTEPESGAFLYRTTTMFLEKLGLNTVDELPPLAPFLPDNVEELADATR